MKSTIVKSKWKRRESDSQALALRPRQRGCSILALDGSIKAATKVSSHVRG
jgi:hypothetical protein